MRRVRRDAGFTLVELLVVISIIGMTVAVLASALTVGVQSGVDSAARLDVSHDEEVLSHVLSDDIASATVIDTVAANCVASPVLRLVVGTEIAYRADPDHTLTRVECAGGAERIVARHLADDPPVVTCTPACGNGVTRLRIDVALCARTGLDVCDTSSARTLRLIVRPRAS
jgi:prepilin-type N-terminal cleavage/methylation domain-containing protein